MANPCFILYYSSSLLSSSSCRSCAEASRPGPNSVKALNLNLNLFNLLGQGDGFFQGRQFVVHLLEFVLLR